jgi:hypothetical protein
MSVLDLSTPAIRALKVRLEADLPAAIADHNLETQSIDLPAPTAILDYVPPISLLVDFPTIGIGDGPTAFEDDNAWSATGRHDLLIIAYCQNADQEVLAWQLRGFARVIATVVLDRRNLGEGAWGTGLTRIEPGPTLADDPENPREFASWVGVRIWAKSEQD